jgi:hypothetical protein
LRRSSKRDAEDFAETTKGGLIGCEIFEDEATGERGMVGREILEVEAKLLLGVIPDKRGIVGAGARARGEFNVTRAEAGDIADLL